MSRWTLGHPRQKIWREPSELEMLQGESQSPCSSRGMLDSRLHAERKQLVVVSGDELTLPCS
jgi:hypothetical protein